MSSDEPRIFLIAGEASGDALGGRLMAALKQQSHGAVSLVGVGGTEMTAEGLESLFPMQDLSVMGFAEIVPRLPLLLRRIRETVAAIEVAEPDAIVTIDSPGFANAVIGRLKNRKAVRIHYVAPSVWAWRPWRVHKYKRNFDHILALLPFEPPYFERVGLPCHHVGHSVIEYGADKGDGPGFRSRHGFTPEETVLCVLPGSRRGEIRRLGPVFGDALRLLQRRGRPFRVVVPTVDTAAEMVADTVSAWPGEPLVLRGAAEKSDAMAAANAALAASGTVALELALARVPSVIAYKVSWLTARIVQPLLTVKYANLINVILDKPVVPERIQRSCTGSALAEDLENLLGAGGREQIAAIEPALAALGADGPAPSNRAAEIILKILSERP
jgi:lipid-A-disaccharide synthase